MNNWSSYQFTSVQDFFLQNELDLQEKKKKETKEKLRDLGNEVRDLEPKHKSLKKLRDEKKKEWKTVMVKAWTISDYLIYLAMQQELNSTHKAYETSRAPIQNCSTLFNHFFFFVNF